MSERRNDEAPPNPLREIVQPFVDLAHAPRALWGVNFSYLLEGFAYWGVLTYLAMYFIEYVGLDDIRADWMVGVLTGGITFSQFFLGGMADRWGARRALLISLALLLVGRGVLASGVTLGLPAGGWMSTLFVVATAGILIVVLGYGMYQPSAYAAVREITTEKTAAMGYAMLYAVMNLGGWLPTFFGPVRRAVGINGALWVYVAVTAATLGLTAVIVSRRTMERAAAQARAERAAETPPEENATPPGTPPPPPGAFLEKAWHWIRNHPLTDLKFSFFIFALIPVQTLFAHNWLTIPLYVARAYRGTWIGHNFEAAVNFNPLLIFILVPIVAAATRHANVYNMMIYGTFVMAAPTFLLALGPSFWTLLGYLVLMTVGEAMWQPRFLQYAAEIAPEGRTGAYIGVAQLPWFLTKLITSVYAGWFLARYVPEGGPEHSATMWLWYGVIAVVSPVLLLIAKPWVGKDFKTKA